MEVGRGGVFVGERGISSGSGMVVDVLIPALNEELSLPSLFGDLERSCAGVVRQVVLVDNGSEDKTPELARASGAVVLKEERRGYGAACLCGLDYLSADPPDILVFLDADYSDFPEQLPRLLSPFDCGAELVIGSRVQGRRSGMALLPQARFGNALSCVLLRLIHGYDFTDLGPFRAVCWSLLRDVEMKDRDFGWTVELQAKVSSRGDHAMEVPVDYRARVGVSKITGTLRGTFRAGVKILGTIASVSFRGDSMDLHLG